MTAPDGNPDRGMRGAVALHRMHAAVEIRLGLLMGSGALHPGRRARGRVVGFQRRLRFMVRIAIVGARRNRLVGAAQIGERVGLADQPRQFGERIALASGRRLMTATVVVVIRGERSILVSISHRDVASPSGKPPTPAIRSE